MGGGISGPHLIQQAREPFTLGCLQKTEGGGSSYTGLRFVLFCPFFLARTLKSHNVLLGTSKDRKCPIIVQTLKDKAICMHGSDVFTIKITKIWRFAPLPCLLKLLSEQLLVE